ncbi:MAG: hypothetical protein R6T83_13085 [Salinibacter sp.]
MSRPRSLLVAVFLLAGSLAVGCGGDTPSASDGPAFTDTLTAETKADSVALRLLEAHGADAFASAPYLRFNFGVDTPEGEQVVARHFWDRLTGEYRVEWQPGSDSSYVALVNVRDVEDQTPEGTVYLNGNELTGDTGDEALQRAYGRFINDTYWLLAPLKVYDPGVNRSYEADSSTADHEVLRLTFGDVGLTSDDTYWFYVSTESGRLDQWSMRLQSMPADAAPRTYEWTDHVTLEAPAGEVTLARRHEAVDGDQAILTNQLALPSSPPGGVFSTTTPMLSTDE